MSLRKLKTIGILGGMGPEAGAYFFGRLIHETEARRDQEHPPVILFSLPQIPDRTEALVHGGPSPVAAIRRGIRTLARAGAQFAVIPCISAHAFYPSIAKDSPIPILSLIDATLAGIKRMKPAPKTIGLIATSGTVRAGALAEAFEAAGIEVLVPSAEDQRKVMAAIYGKDGIKAGAGDGPPRRLLVEAANGLIARGARAIVAGCTEVPLVLRPDDLPVPLIDPLTLGARAALRLSGASLRS